MTTGIYLTQPRDAVVQTCKLVGYFREFIRGQYARAHVPANVPFTQSMMDKQDAQTILSKLVNVAINRKAGLTLSPAQEARCYNWLWDSRMIHEYTHLRIRHSGCRNLLRTPRLKALYPHIDNQPVEH